ncbi:hypothetical protein HK096_003742 [Nowakowskiella sp. JEL0078]|nr:hypothetical protein HK096_003742 [Nowakowskiella sp. JEL0078]
MEVVSRIAAVGRVTRALILAAVLFGLALGVNAVQILTMWIALFSVRLRLLLNGSMAYIVWYWMNLVFEYLDSAKISFSGDILPYGENAIVICNHMTWTDYFAKDSLKFVPGIGWGEWCISMKNMKKIEHFLGMYMMGMIFIKRNWNNDKKNIDKTFNNIKSTRLPVWIISYLEGTRQTPEKLEESQAFARQRGLPILKNIMLPRTKGFIATVNTLRNSHVQAIYDLTIAYSHNTEGFQAYPHVVRLHTGALKEYNFHIHMRRFLIEDIPQDDEELSKWLIKRWEEKDQILQQLRENWTDGLQLHHLPAPWIIRLKEEELPLLG